MESTLLNDKINSKIDTLILNLNKLRDNVLKDTDEGNKMEWYEKLEGYVENDFAIYLDLYKYDEKNNNNNHNDNKPKIHYQLNSPTFYNKLVMMKKKRKRQIIVESIEDYKEKEKDRIIVYCDGCCKRNGSVDAICGIGIWFGDNDPRNVSEIMKGKQTNNTSELEAISRVLDIVDNNFETYNQEIEIRSDSQYAVNILTKPWKVNKNIQLVNEIRKKLQRRKKVTLIWIRRDTERGNIEADKLSKLCLELTK